MNYKKPESLSLKFSGFFVYNYTVKLTKKVIEIRDKIH